MLKEGLLKKLFFLLSFLLFSQANAQDIKILEPQGKTSYENEDATIVIKVDTKNIDRLKISTNDGTVHHIKVTKDKDTYCTTIKLDFGDNSIFIRAYKDNVKKFQKSTELYFRTDVYRKYEYTPQKYKKNYFHTTKNENRCKTCHKMSSNEKKNEAFENPKDSNCYNCHNKILKYKDAHAPAVNWVCSSCHGGVSKFTKYPSPTQINKSCLKCHKKFKSSFREKKYKHEPVVEGRCNRCHDSHSSPTKYFIKLPSNKLCVTCHATKSATFKEEDSDCAASSEKSCVICHNPHSSNHKLFYEPGRQNKKKEEKKKSMWIDED